MAIFSHVLYPITGLSLYYASLGCNVFIYSDVSLWSQFTIFDTDHFSQWETKIVGKIGSCAISTFLFLSQWQFSVVCSTGQHVYLFIIQLVAVKFLFTVMSLFGHNLPSSTLTVFRNEKRKLAHSQFQSFFFTPSGNFQSRVVPDNLSIPSLYNS